MPMETGQLQPGREQWIEDAPVHNLQVVQEPEGQNDLGGCEAQSEVIRARYHHHHDQTQSEVIRASSNRGSLMFARRTGSCERSSDQATKRPSDQRVTCCGLSATATGRHEGG